MPAAARFMWRNLINELSSVTLTASSAAVPVTNIAHHALGKAWLTDGISSESVTIDLGTTTEAVKAVLISGHNLTTAGTAEVLHSTDNITFTSLGVRTASWPTTGGNVKNLSFFFSSLSRRYWRIVLKDPTNPDNFIKVGRLFLGDYWEPAAQIMRNWSVEIVDDTEVDKSIGGQKWRNVRDCFARISFRLPHLSKSEAIENFLNFARRIGTKDSIFVSLFPDGSDSLRGFTDLYGKFVTAPGISGPAISIYSTDEVLFEADS
jgi:hypothetical protein